MTAMSPQSVLDGSLDIDALVLFVENLPRVTIVDVHRLHAKVYVADERRAIITSGNLTASAFTANFEYGVLVTDSAMAKRVSNHMQDYAQAGREVSGAELSRLHETSRHVLLQHQRTARELNVHARRELAEEWNNIAATFGAPPGLYETGSARFKSAIADILSSHGQMTTRELCRIIQASWPYLCDDTLMRVARDGSRKRRWRHDIHTAQETLQRAGLIRRDREGRWYVHK